MSRAPTALLLVAIMLLPLLASAAAEAEPGHAVAPYRALVDPELLAPAGYDEPFDPGLSSYSALLAKLVEAAPVEREPMEQPFVKIVFSVAGDIEYAEAVIEDSGVKPLLMVPLPGRVYVEALATREQVQLLASTPGVIYVAKYRSPLASIVEEREVLGRAEPSLEPGSGAAPATYKAVEVLGAVRVWEEFGVTGEGVKVAVVDTGVDFGHSDLGSESIARTEEGVPILFDSDEFGLVLTLSTATVDEQGYIYPELPVIVYDWAGLVFGYDPIYALDTGFVVYIAPDGTLSVKVFPIDRFYAGGIEFQGDVKFGLAVQTLFINYGGQGIAQYTLPVIYVDSDGDGSYDTVYADTSTVYYFLVEAMAELGYAAVEPDEALKDFSFADEKPAMYGDEVIARDFTGDGVNDFSAGALAGYLYDWLGLFTGQFLGNAGWIMGYDYVGAILPGLDPNGNYLTLIYDVYGHGTAVAGVIGSRGNVEYDLGYTVTRMPGIAPGAKIAANMGFLVNVFVAQFFLAGFEPSEENPAVWIYTGHGAQVDAINNSWGNSFLLVRGFLTGVDDYSMIEDYIVATSGTIVVHAMGNGGPGYGTGTTPGVSSLVISVGASTLFDYRPLYGYLPGPGGDVVSWSDRGPSQVGVAKPDVVNIGSFEWSAIQVIAGMGDGARAVDLFGGTSEATPMTTGVVALIIDAYMREFGVKPTPTLVKTVLKSTARDLGYDAFTQGSGHADAYAAVKAIMEGGVAYVESTSVYENVYAMLTRGEYSYLAGPVGDTNIYTGVVEPGTTAEAAFKVKTVKGEASVAGVKAYKFHVVRKPALEYLNLEEAAVFLRDGSTASLAERIVEVDAEKGVIYVRLVGDEARIFIPVAPEALDPLPIKEYMTEFIVSFPYEVADPQGTYGAAPGLPFLLLGAEFHVGFDIDGDGVIAPGETARVNYDIRYSNTLHVDVGNSETKLEEVAAYVADRLGIDVAAEDAVPILDLRVFFNGYAALMGSEVVVPLRIEVAWLHRIPADNVTVELADATVTPEGVEGTVYVEVPEDAAPGVYQYYIEIEYEGGMKTLVPMTVPVAAVVGASTLEFGGTVEEAPYTQYAVSGKNDWSWRYESGDWRTFPVVFKNEGTIGIVVKVEWMSPATAIDVAVGGPGYGHLYEPPAYVYGAIIAAKLGYHGGALGGSGLVPRYDRPYPGMAIIVAPVSDPAVPHWIVVRNSILDATSYIPEPFKVYVTPIIAEVAAPGDAAAGETVAVTVKVYGSTLISYSSIIVEAEGAEVSAPEKLGFGNTHEFTVEVVPQQPTTVKIYLATKLAPQYLIGFDFAGQKYTIHSAKAVLEVEVPISVTS